jgi:hypothetical protein
MAPATLLWAPMPQTVILAQTAQTAGQARGYRASTAGRSRPRCGAAPQRAIRSAMRVVSRSLFLSALLRLLDVLLFRRYAVPHSYFLAWRCGRPAVHRLLSWGNELRSNGKPPSHGGHDASMHACGCIDAMQCVPLLGGRMDVQPRQASVWHPVSHRIAFKLRSSSFSHPPISLVCVLHRTLY